MTRRRVIALASVALASSAAAGSPVALHATVAPKQRHDAKTPITHIVTLLQENHTYDNYFGTYPRGDGLPAKTCVPFRPRNPSKGCVKPFHIGTNDVALGDLDHSTATFRLQLDGGRMDGFVSALQSRNQDGRLALAYYDGRDLPYYWNLADEYVLFDHFFSSSGAGSFLNHLYWVAGAGGGDGDRVSPTGITNVTTIFDRLEQAGISWKFYVQNYEPRLNYRTLDQFPPNRSSQVTWVPLLNFPRFIDDPRLNKHIVDLNQYYRDLARGTLPAVSFIAPSGPSEHPPSSVGSGQAFVRTLINQLIESKQWNSSAFLLAYDDWGGWYDHVRPPQVDAHGYGFRVPALLVSPYARRGYVDHTVLDFTSILRFIEDNWSVKPLASRDRSANSFVRAFDFTKPPRPRAFTSARRGAGSASTASVRTGRVYALYGGAVLVVVLLILAGLARRQAPTGPAPGRQIRSEE